MNEPEFPSVTFLRLSRIISSNFDIKMMKPEVAAVVLVQTAHHRDLFTGLIRIHVLAHAVHEPIFGLAMMEELKLHGYRIGPGTLYPLLHGMERAGILKSALRKVAGRRRRIYVITSFGRKALTKAREKVDELHRELHEDPPRPLPQPD